MAEIHVEKKPRRSIWPWVILLLVIAVAVWAVVTYGDRLGIHTLADPPLGVPALALAG